MSSGSLRDQLKALGLAKPKAEPEPATDRRGAARKPAPKPRVVEAAHGRPAQRAPESIRSNRPADTDAEISLAKAYAARQAAEAAEAAEQRRLQEEKARIKRERKAAALMLLEGKSLLKADAELPRHFEYGRKIRRIYVDAEQMAALNGGRLGIAQLDGKFLLVDQTVIDELATIAPEFVALRVIPGEGVSDDAIPPDLHW